jgi:hypothetical protein
MDISFRMRQVQGIRIYLSWAKFTSIDFAGSIKDKEWRNSELERLEEIDPLMTR